jgi:hypothetical protein
VAGSGCGSRQWVATALQRVALAASTPRHSAVAEYCVKYVSFLCTLDVARCVAISHCAVIYTKAWFLAPSYNPQFEAGTAASREVLRPPLNVEDAVGSSATYRGEYAEPLFTKYRSSQYG